MSNKPNVRVHFQEGGYEDIYFPTASKRREGDYSGLDSAWIEYDEFWSWANNKHIEACEWIG